MPRKRIRRLKAGYKLGDGPKGGTTRRGRVAGPSGSGTSRTGGRRTLQPTEFKVLPGIQAEGGTTRRTPGEPAVKPMPPVGSGLPRTAPTPLKPGPKGGTTKRSGPVRKAEPGRKSPMAGPRRLLEPGQKRRIRRRS